MNDLNIQPHEPDEITNSEDMLDSRDIQERIDWLESDAASGDEYSDQDCEAFAEELKKLANLKEQYINDYGDSSWGYGAQFIRDSYFEEYAMQLADDIGAINEKQSWPSMYIDWERATEALQMDYTEVDYDGIIYWTREA
jgi:hypothetical protein